MKSPRVLPLFFAALLLAFALGGCNAKSNVTGSVNYPQKITLPPDAVVIVQLQDISLADAPPALIGEQTITEAGQVPIDFAVSYEYRDIDDAHLYAVQARIENQEGKLLFVSDSVFPVLTQGNPTEDVEILVVPVSTSMPSNPANLLGEPDGLETFESANNWLPADASCYHTEIKDGKYVMTANGIEGSACWETSWPLIRDFYVEATIEMPGKCNPQDQFGLIFRADDRTRGYRYGLSCNGGYSLTLENERGSDSVVSSTLDPVIATGAGITNRIGILATTDHYYLFINGQYVDQGSNSAYLEAGKLGFYVRAASSQGFTVKFDDLAVWLLTDAYYPPEAVRPNLPDVAVESPPVEVPTVTAVIYANVRSGPGIEFPILGAVKKGITGEVVGNSSDQQWWAIKVPASISGTGIAWIAKDYASLNNTNNDPIPTVETPGRPPLAGVPAPGPGDPGVIFTEVTSVRSGPGIQYPVYGVAPVGSKAKVVGFSEDQRWWAVEISSSLDRHGYGWVYKDFTSTLGIKNIPVTENPRVPENILPAPPRTGEAAAVTRESILVRSGPGSNYATLGQIPIGAAMLVVGQSADGEFWVVKIPKSISTQEQGWVASRYCHASHIEQVPIISPSSQP